MSGHVLRLTEDVLEPGAGPWPLPAAPRVLYVLRGAVVVEAGGRQVPVDASAAWHGAGPCAVRAGADGAGVLRYELVRQEEAEAPGGGRSIPRLAHPILLDPAEAHLMRCDRVDFDPGGEALPHRHRGGGIRYLVTGALEVRIEGQPDRAVRPGQAWFESGREPVHAIASAGEPTSFIRCSILPASIRGRSSIVYVDERHAAVRPRRYTVFVDEPIALP